MSNISFPCPSQDFLQNFVSDELSSLPLYKIDALAGESIKLNQNESPYDWPQDLKEKVCERLAKQPWNAYPSPYPTELEDAIADECHVERGGVLASPGSSRLLEMLISHLGIGAKNRWVILSPSFGLYESLAKASGAHYCKWPLGEDYQVDMQTIPQMRPKDIVLIATPNNPTGTELGYELLDTLLSQNPEILLICDNAYHEFSDEPYEKLLQKYANIIILRTFSKSFGAAGLRFGYMLAAKPYVDLMRKTLLPYSFNHFSLLAIEELLKDSQITQSFQAQVQQVVTERDMMYESIHKLFANTPFGVVPSKANFLFLHFPTLQQCTQVYDALKQKRILLRLFAKEHGASLRVSVGTPEHNQAFLNALSSIVDPS